MGGGGPSNQTTTVQNPAWLDAASQNMLSQGNTVYNNLQGNALQDQARGTAGAWGSMAPGAFGQAYNVMTDNANFATNNSWLGPAAQALGIGQPAAPQNPTYQYGAPPTGGSSTPPTPPVSPRPSAAQADATTINRGDIGQVNAQTIPTMDMSAYLNPYNANVRDNVLSDNERARQMQAQNDSASAVSAGAFGGSRHGVVDAMTNSEFQRNAGQLSNQLNQQGFQDATALMQADANRALQAGQFNSGMDWNVANTNAGAQNSNSQFNAGQTNALTAEQIRANAQRAAASASANASLQASLHATDVNSQNSRINMMLQLAQLGMGGDLAGAQFREGTARDLQGFGQGGLNAGYQAGNDLYDQPMSNLSWLSNIVGAVPHGQSSTVPIYHNRTAGALGGAASGASAGASFGPWGALAGGVIGAGAGYFGS